MIRIRSMLAVLTLLVAASASHAVTIVIDDFSQLDQSISDLTTGDGAVSDTNAVRTLTAELLANVDPTQQLVQVSFGVLDVTNGTGEDSQVTAAWNIIANLFPLNAVNTAIFFNVVESDGNPTQLKLTLDGNDLGTFQVPGNTLNQLFAFPVDPVVLNQGGLLMLTIDGEAGWDMTVDSLGLSFDERTAVPEPVSLGLLGIGFAAIGFRRRRIA